MTDREPSKEALETALRQLIVIAEHINKHSVERAQLRAGADALYRDHMNSYDRSLDEAFQAIYALQQDKSGALALDAFAQQARDAALEEAARECEAWLARRKQTADEIGKSFTTQTELDRASGEIYAYGSLARAIRALKSKPAAGDQG